MNIPSHELHAFHLVAQLLNFSHAAERIHISQSALSQRIQRLEQKLGLTLLIRDKKSIKLTEAGVRLLRYCQAKDHLESEFLSDIISHVNGKLRGHLRVAAYSSILHSVIIPTLAPLLREHTGIHFEFSMHEMNALPGILLRGEADFVLMDHYHHKDNLVTHLLGYEQYVLAQSKCYPLVERYLDHDPNDNLTASFFSHQKMTKKSFMYSYVNDIEGVLLGIILGIGQGVVPLHLLHNQSSIKIDNTVKPMSMPIILHYFKQPYYSKLQQITIETLKQSEHLLQCLHKKM